MILYSKLRPRQLRWFSFVTAAGLACWIGLSGQSILAQQQYFAPETILKLEHIDVKLTEATGVRMSVSSNADPVGNSNDLILSEIAESALSEADMLRSTPSGKQPTKVSVGLHVSNLADINQASETFDIAGYLMYSWRDARLAYTPQPNETSRASSLDKIWHPAIEMVNFKSSTNSDTLVDILPNGIVHAQERFAKTLSSELALQNFPFDRQSLQVVLESLKYDDRTVSLVADSPKIGIGTDSFVSLSEWQIGLITGNNSKSFFPPENSYYSRVSIKIDVKRNFGFYILKVIVPLLLITIASWSVFWIDPQEFSTQITIAFTNLLTVVALLLVINDKLPRVGYLTFMDGFTMLCFLTILIAILVLIIAHRSKIKDNHHRAQKVQDLARWIVPTGFVLSNLILLASMNFLHG